MTYAKEKTEKNVVEMLVCFNKMWNKGLLIKINMHRLHANVSVRHTMEASWMEKWSVRCACFETVIHSILSADIVVVAVFPCASYMCWSHDGVCVCKWWLRAHQNFNSENDFSSFFLCLHHPLLSDSIRSHPSFSPINSNYNLLKEFSNCTLTAPVSFDRFFHKLSAFLVRYHTRGRDALNNNNFNKRKRKPVKSKRKKNCLKREKD